jgi:putative solute:sodium symporter small subunit
MTDHGQGGRWRATARLSLAVVVVVAIVVFFFLSLAEDPGHTGYPLGLAVAVTGLPLALALLVFWFAGRQERIDRQHGLYES